MIRNLLLIALRNLKKDKWFSLLNILGLTIGISFSLFLIFYVKDELNYDRYHEKANRIFRINSYIQEKDNNNFYETKVLYADSTVFKIFSHKFIEGNPATALTEPSSIVISKTLAEKYFGKNVVVGQTLKTVYDVYK